MKWFLPMFLFAVVSLSTAYIVLTYTSGDFDLMRTGWPALLGGIIGGVLGSRGNHEHQTNPHEAQIGTSGSGREPIRSIWQAPIVWIALVVVVGITVIVNFL